MARKTRSRRKSRRARRIRGSRRVRTYYGGEEGSWLDNIGKTAGEFGKKVGEAAKQATETAGEFGKKVGAKVGETTKQMKQTNLFGSSDIPAQSAQDE